MLDSSLSLLSRLISLLIRFEFHEIATIASRFPAESMLKEEFSAESSSIATRPSTSSSVCRRKRAAMKLVALASAQDHNGNTAPTEGRSPLHL